jgi:hypothetical protein
MRSGKKRGDPVTFACALTFDFDAMSVANPLEAWCRSGDIHAQPI